MQKIPVTSAAVSIFFSLLFCSQAVELISVSPITDKIIVVEFDEGRIDSASFYSPVLAENFHYDGLLDTARAGVPATYTISSPNDPAYGAQKIHPLHVGRKSKGTQFSGDLTVFRKNLPPYLSKHWLYLQLPFPLKTGASYVIAVEGLTKTNPRQTFRFNEALTPSETIHLNQLGFRPDAKKFAYLSQFMGDFDVAPHLQGGLNLDDYQGSAFSIVRADNGKTVFSGTVALQQEKTKVDVKSPDYGPTGNLTHADVWQADFSALQTPGRYRLVVARMGCSPVFEIGEDVYRRAYVAAMRGLFFQRAGVEKQVREFGDLIYPADQVTNAMYYLPSVGRKEAGRVSDTSRPVRGIWGWYHDAGDWDGYARHTGVPASLLLAYTLAPEKFGDGDIGNRWRRPPSVAWVDEGLNGIPDILDEAGWLLTCFRRARHVLINQGYGSGGVPAYFGIDSCGKANASWLDDRALVVHGEDAKLTAEYAGLAAWYATALQHAKAPMKEVVGWVNEARESYRWAESHGGLDGEEAWLANVGLYFATAEPQYQSAFLSRFNPKANWEYWGSADARQFALFLYALIPTNHPNLNIAEQSAKRQLIANTADAFWVKNGMTRGFRATHIAGYQRLFLGSLSTPRTLFPMVAYTLTREERFADAAQFAADYTLGGNPMNLICMSGLGPTSEDAVFHPDSWMLLANRPGAGCQTLPGLTPFGANFTFDWFGPNYQHSGSENFSRSSAYPIIWRKSGTSFGGMGPAWKNANEIPQWAPPDSLGEGPGNDTAFPPGEQRFFNRFSIPGSEFTVNQTLSHNAFTYALLIDGFRKVDQPSSTPSQP